ncbi:MAG: hypothetical protein NDI75_05900 [Candidatus Didemnitutus sp.]|nr:hypothetical protein [Candidatus Didemnitutus sp.]
MKSESKALIAAWGYIAMGTLSASIFLPGVIDSLPNGMTIGVFAALGFIVFGCWSIIFGLSRLFMPAADRGKWFAEFQQQEKKIRGGSPRTVIILGCIAIALLGGASTYFLWFF